MKYTILDTTQNSDQKSLTEEFALDVLLGFSHKEKYLSSKYFYDKKGSDLFTQIMDVEEYYPTDCEFEILNSHKKEIVEKLKGEKVNIVELGAGDGKKTKILLQELLDQGVKCQYHPVDISEDAVKGLSKSLEVEMPDLEFSGVVGQYIPSINWISENKEGRNLILFLGSNLGNFSMPDALVFLRTLWNSLNDKDLLLIGFDFKKDIGTLLGAYNDSKGVTRDFNLNILTRINNELGGTFDITKFQHYGTYNPLKGAMESYLVSLAEQEVYIDHLQKSFHFKEFEPIHLEYSFKYLHRDIEFLSSETGFKNIKLFYDSRKYFTDALWQVNKS